MMAERDLRRADLARDAIQYAAAKPRAQRAHRRAVGNHALDDAVRVLLDDAEVDAAAREIARQHVGREAGLLLVEVDGDDCEWLRRAPLQRQQDVEEPVAVLAARQANHDAVAAFDHRVIGDRRADLAAQALAQLVDLERGLARIAATRRRRDGRDEIDGRFRVAPGRPERLASPLGGSERSERGETFHPPILSGGWREASVALERDVDVGRAARRTRLETPVGQRVADRAIETAMRCADDVDALDGASRADREAGLDAAPVEAGRERLARERRRFACD